MHTNKCDSTIGQKCPAKGRSEAKIQDFMYRDTKNAELEMYNWIHRNRNKRFKDKFGSHTRNTGEPGRKGL